MAAHKSVKNRQCHYRIVGVISTSAELDLAMRMSNPPDLFELRLDRLLVIEKKLETKMSMLPAPIIVTARHPAEGGANNLPTQHRRDLLLRFLPGAQYFDVELRSANQLRTVLNASRKENVRGIISFHDFASTPSLESLRAKARAAKLFGPHIFKVATRTDTPDQLGRLLDFVAKKNVGVAVSAMGIGKLGAISRILLAHCGSALVYTSLSEPTVEGQMSLEQFRAALRAFELG